MTREFEFVSHWANGEILTNTAPADRQQLRKLLRRYTKFELALNEIANNGVEFQTPEGSYIVDSNPIEVAQKALL